MDIYIWLAIAIISLIAEFSTSGLTTIWFVPSALVSMVLAIFDLPITAQIAAFIVLSALFLIFFYKKLKENIENKSEKTNLDALIGKEALVEDSIPPRGIGRVKVGGISWSAYMKDPKDSIKKGEYVKIIAIDGVKLEVEKVPSEITQ